MNEDKNKPGNQTTLVTGVNIEKNQLLESAPRPSHRQSFCTHDYGPYTIDLFKGNTDCAGVTGTDEQRDNNDLKNKNLVADYSSEIKQRPLQEVTTGLVEILQDLDNEKRT